MRAIASLYQGASQLVNPGTAKRSDRKSTRLNSSHLGISYAVFCLKKKDHTTKLQFLRHLLYLLHPETLVSSLHQFARTPNDPITVRHPSAAAAAQRLSVRMHSLY